MTDRLSVRPVQISDVERLAEIYSYYVHNTAVSFEYEAPSADDFIKRIEHTTELDHYIHEGNFEGIGHCALGYAAEPAKDAAPRKENYVYYVE